MSPEGLWAGKVTEGTGKKRTWPARRKKLSLGITRTGNFKKGIRVFNWNSGVREKEGLILMG